MSWQQLQLLFDLEGDEEDIIAWAEEDKDALREMVLRDALQTMLDGRTGKRTREELWKWILTDTGPFSFVACARTVGVDPHTLRVTFGRFVERQALLGEANEEFLGKTASLLAMYLEEPAARSRVHVRH